MTAEELREREIRIANSGNQQGVDALHPGDYGDGVGSTQGIPLNAFSQDMAAADHLTRSILNDPMVTGVVGEEGAQSEIVGGQANVSIFGVDPKKIQAPSAAEHARAIARANQQPPPSPRQPVVPMTQSQPQPQHSDPGLSPETSPPPPVRTVPMPVSQGAAVEFLLQQNHALRGALAELAKRHGEKPSFVDSRLVAETVEADLDPDEIAKMVQIVLVEMKDGMRSHAILVNGNQVNASAFSVDVDIDNGTFEIDVNLRKSLF